MENQRKFEMGELTDYESESNSQQDDLNMFERKDGHDNVKKSKQSKGAGID